MSMLMSLLIRRLKVVCRMRSYIPCFLLGWEVISRDERLSRLSHRLRNLRPCWQDLRPWVQGVDPRLKEKVTHSILRCSEPAPSSTFDFPSSLLSPPCSPSRWSLMQRLNQTTKHGQSLSSTWTRWWRTVWLSWRVPEFWTKWGSWELLQPIGRRLSWHSGTYPTTTI